MKVKDFSKWQKILFSDRAILKDDIKYLSWEQIKALNNLDVILAEDSDTTLIVENQ